MSEIKKNKTEFKAVDTSDHRDDYIVEHLIIKKGVPIGEDNEEVSVVEEYIETKKYKRQEYINSFRDEVGIVNMLKKVNAGLLNPGVLAANFDLHDENNVIDISNVPEDIGDAMSMVDNAHKLYSSLPIELTKNMSFNDFCQKFDQKAFDRYIESKTTKEEVKDVK